ncbi:Yersinia protein of uncharacterised function (DUF3831) [Yersinia enterocolitica]|nr:Yersinia protein of uncharacterised function (DUF3831) [Yersinia enterocolitica]
MTNLSYSNWQGEDRQKSKASVPGMAGTSLHGCIDGVFTICLFSP